jgi:spore germination cell wall hydrolase CwlJ-like protein
MKPLKPVRQKANTTHRSRLARKAGKWNRRFYGLTIIAALILASLAYVNRGDELGSVGVVGMHAEGIHLSCGGKYNPLAGEKTAADPHPAKSLEIFHPTLPCGSKVMVTNPANGKKALAVVANQKVMFTQGQGRTADISVATAEALGIDPQQPTAAILSLRPLAGKLQGLLTVVPVVTTFQHAPQKPAQLKKKELNALTLNLVHECGICTPEGMVAVAQVTLNRVNVHYRKKTTIHDVVYDGSDTISPQFSWTNNPKAADKEQLAMAQVISQGMGQDRLSGNLLATQYVVTKDALNYFQPEIVYPGWAKRGRGLELVPMSNTLEVMLMHRFLRPVRLQLASL